MNTCNGSTFYHWSKDASIYPTMCIFSIKTTLCKKFSSTTSLGSLLSYMPSTHHLHKVFCKNIPCVTCNIPPNTHVDEWNQVTTIYAYVASRMVMVHSTTHYEYLGKPPTLPVAPTRKIPSPIFHSHLMKLK